MGIEQIQMNDKHNVKLRSDFRIVQENIDHCNADCHNLQRRCDDTSSRIRNLEAEFDREKRYEGEYLELLEKLKDLEEKIHKLKHTEVKEVGTEEMVFETEEQHKVIEEDLNPLERELKMLEDENCRLNDTLGHREKATGSAVTKVNVPTTRPGHALHSLVQPQHSKVIGGHTTHGGSSHLQQFESSHVRTSTGHSRTVDSRSNVSRVAPGGTVLGGATMVQSGTRVSHEQSHASTVHSHQASRTVVQGSTVHGHGSHTGTRVVQGSTVHGHGGHTGTRVVQGSTVHGHGDGSRVVQGSTVHGGHTGSRVVQGSTVVPGGTRVTGGQVRRA